MKFTKKTLFISRLSLLVSLTLIIQIAGFPQPITGPLINAMLLITTSLIGCIGGVTLGCLTPIIAILRGQLPPILASLVPFIAVGNSILVIVFFIVNYRLKIKVNQIRRFQVYFAIFSAAVAKFLFLVSTVKIIFPLILMHQVPQKYITLLMIPQLFTALIGGIIFLTLLKILDKAGIWHQ